MNDYIVRIKQWNYLLLTIVVSGGKNTRDIWPKRAGAFGHFPTIPFKE